LLGWRQTRLSWFAHGSLLTMYNSAKFLYQSLAQSTIAAPGTSEQGRTTAPISCWGRPDSRHRRGASRVVQFAGLGAIGHSKDCPHHSRTRVGGETSNEVRTKSRQTSEHPIKVVAALRDETNWILYQAAYTMLLCGLDTAAPGRPGHIRAANQKRGCHIRAWSRVSCANL
jgi:hypothetical protein